VEQLAGCERAANLQQLNLGLNKCGSAVPALLRSPHLGNLRRLRLNQNQALNAACAVLAEADRFPHLRELDLNGNLIGEPGARELARCGWLRRLDHLGLTDNGIGDAGLEALTSSDALANKRSLNLTGCGLSSAAGRLLADCRHLAGLRELHVATNNLPCILGELARSPHLQGLRKLGLLGNWVAMKSDAEGLVNAPMAPNLRYLRLRCPSSEALQVLLRAPSLAGLTWLELSGCDGVASADEIGTLLHEAGHLTNLRHLDVHSANLGDAGADALAKSPHLASLTRLEISNDKLTDSGFAALIASPYLKRELHLAVGWSRMSYATRQALHNRFAVVGW
jgi:Leucine-rich repeat (LRR) protein